MSAAELTLYAVEQDLQSYLDTEEMVPDEQLAEFQAALSAAGAAALDKRDACIRAFQAIDAQIEFCKRERERLGERQKTLENGLKRFRKYLAGVMEATGQKKLEGRIGTISYRKGSQAVEVVDVAAVPVECKSIIVEMPAEDWEGLRAAIRNNATYSGVLDAATHRGEWKVDKKALKSVLDSKSLMIRNTFKDELAFAADDAERAEIEQAIADDIATVEKEHGARLTTGDPTVAVK